MILCFSGTGNSRYIAKKIAVELQDEIVDVNAKIKAVDYSPIKTGENVVVVTPTYAWRIPRIVSDWLSKTKLLSAKRIWFVMNCGSEIGKNNVFICWFQCQTAFANIFRFNCSFFGNRTLECLAKEISDTFYTRCGLYISAHPPHGTSLDNS